MNGWKALALITLLPSIAHAQRYTDPRDGQVYPTVFIGGVEWFARNLDHEQEGAELNIPDSSSCANWGRTYDRASSRRACPDGWRLPTREDWALVDTTDVFGLLDTLCWANAELHTNSSGLTLVPSGFKHRKSYWNRYLSSAIWFDDPDPESNWHLHVHGNNADFTHYLHDHKEKIKVRRFAVRCVRPAHPTH